jgi:hypothetical protein
MVGANRVPLYFIIADCADTLRNVEVVTVESSRGSISERGAWKRLNVTPTDIESLDAAWGAFSRPGAKEDSTLAQALFVEGLLDEISRYDVIAVEVDVDPSAHPGSRMPITVSATLSDGLVVRTTGLLIAQDITVPSGWIQGDTHVHTDLADPSAFLDNDDITSLAESYGHDFTYITDHLDRIRSCEDLDADPALRWSKWRERCLDESSGSYTQCAGIEVTAVNGTGDALGYGMPVIDPTQIQNRQHSCSALIDLLNGSESGASAYIAHPAGPPLDWDDPNVAYYGVQAVAYGETFWKNGINSGHRSAATGGSDAHIGWFFIGQATWLYAPTWATQSTWESKMAAIDACLKSGKVSATTDGSFGYFCIGSNYPGSSMTASTGSTIYYSLDARSLDNGYDVQITWDLYRDNDSNRVDGGTTSVLESGSMLQYSGLSTTVVSGKHGYYLKIRFDYKDELGTVLASKVFCGPIYVTGT